MIEPLIGLGALTGVSAATLLSRLWLQRRAQRAHVRNTRTAWMRAGRRVRFGPVGTSNAGPLPQHSYRLQFGALGIVDDRLVIEGHRDHHADIELPPSSIARVGLCIVPVQAGARVTDRRALHVHYTGPGGWRVATIVTDDPQAIAMALHRHTGLPVYDSGTARDDFGPMPATQMQQDIYGDWDPVREGDLYLAPDRVIFNWQDAIALETIARIDVLRQGTWRDRLPDAEGLLRIEHTTGADDAHAVTGYVVRRAGEWAAAIQRHIRAPIPVQIGRKKRAG